MTRIDMAIIAARYGATITATTRYTQCKPQRRWKYGRHSVYLPGYPTIKKG